MHSLLPLPKSLFLHLLQNESLLYTSRTNLSVLSKLVKNYIEFLQGHLVDSWVQIFTLCSLDSQYIKTVVVANHNGCPSIRL